MLERAAVPMGEISRVGDVCDDVTRGRHLHGVLAWLSVCF